MVKNPPASAEDVGSIPGSGKSPEEGNGNSVQYSCLGNPMDRRGWRATVLGVARELDKTTKQEHCREYTFGIKLLGLSFCLHVTLCN